MSYKMKTLIASALITWSVAGVAAEPIKIGVSGPLTGGSAPMGVSMRDGVKLAVAEINAKGGVLGRPLQIVERDDEAKNERGVQVAQELINKEHVVATVGYANTGVAIASQRFYQNAKIPVMNSVATGSVVTKQFVAPEFTENYIFRNAANDTVQSAMIVDEAVVKRKLAAKGIKPVAVEKFNIKDVDMTAQLLKAKQGGAQAILTYGIGPELAQIANGMEKLGWKVPMIGSWTLSMGNFLDNAGKNGNGASMPQTFIQDPNTPKRKAFIEAYQKAYKIDRIPSPVSAAQGYDSIYLLAAAIKQAGTTDGSKVRLALENLNEKVEGVVTTYVKPFTHDDHEAIKAGMPVMGEAKDGHIVLAK